MYSHKNPGTPIIRLLHHAKQTQLHNNNYLNIFIPQKKQ